MLSGWRSKFNLALPFIWVQLAPWVGHEAATSDFQLPALRAAQMAVQVLPLIAVHVCNMGVWAGATSHCRRLGC